MSELYRHTGKEILRGREHFLDARDEPTAQAVTFLLNYGRIFVGEIDMMQAVKVQDVIWPQPTTEIPANGLR